MSELVNILACEKEVIGLDTEKKLELVRVLIDNVADDFNEEDILHMMLEKKISADIEKPDR